MFLTNKIRNLNPDYISVCNNACWAIGEVAIVHGEGMKQHIQVNAIFAFQLQARKRLFRSCLFYSYFKSYSRQFCLHS